VIAKASIEPSERSESHTPADREDPRPVVVQEVGGQPYSFKVPPARTTPFLLIAPIGAFVATLDFIHFAGIPLVLVGLAGANPRMSPLGGGCLPFLVIVAAIISALAYPEVGIPLAVWGALSWLVGSLELRLSMKPYCPSTPDEPPAA
jgi:hypothetical protein